MSGFAWLDKLMTWIGQWFPRVVLVKAGHLAVRFDRGGRSVQLAPGLYVYWPIVADVKIVSTRRRTTEIATMVHGREAISVVVAYSIRDARTMLLYFDDVFSSLDDRTQAHLCLAYKEIDQSAEISERVLAGLVAEFAHHGVFVHSVDVVQRGPVTTLKHLKDWAQHSKAELC